RRLLPVLLAHALRGDRGEHGPTGEEAAALRPAQLGGQDQSRRGDHAAHREAVAYPLGDTGDGIAAELVGEGLVPEHGLAAGVPEGLPDLGDLEEVVEGADPAADDPDPCTGEVLGAGVVDGVQLASAEFRSTG